MLGILGGGIISILLVILFIILFPLMALISILMNNFHGNDKLMWIVIVLLLPFLGAFLYFILGRNKRI